MGSIPSLSRQELFSRQSIKIMTRRVDQPTFVLESVGSDIFRCGEAAGARLVPRNCDTEEQHSVWAPLRPVTLDILFPRVLTAAESSFRLFSLQESISLLWFFGVRV